MHLPQTDRILLTRIKREYECDTFFPVDLDAEGSGWRRAARAELEAWTGEKVAGDGEGVVEEGGVEFEFGLWERVRD